MTKSALEAELAFQLRAARIPPPVPQLRFAPPRRFAADFGWPDRMLLVEVDGGTWVQGRHSRGSGIEGDAEKQTLAALLGWRVMRFTGAMVRDGRALGWLEQEFATPQPERG